LPLTTPTAVDEIRSRAFANPKSMIFGSPFAQRKMLLGLTSRCTRSDGAPDSSRSSCAKWSASAILAPIHASTGYGSFAPRAAAASLTSRSVLPRKSSIAR